MLCADKSKVKTNKRELGEKLMNWIIRYIQINVLDTHR